MMSRLMTPREQLVVGFIGVAVLVGSATAIWLNREPAPEPVTAVEPAAPAVEEAQPADPAPSTAPAPAPAEPHTIVVSVQGAVASPGVYTMDSDDRVNDLLMRAGGPTASAEMDDINLAARLIDGSTLTIPESSAPIVRDGVVTLRRTSTEKVPNPPQYTLSGWVEADVASGEAPAVVPAADVHVVSKPSPAAGSLVDLNRASVEQLQDLPGIGPVLAQSIVDYRSNAPFTTVEQLQNVRGIGPKRFESLRDLVTVGP